MKYCLLRYEALSVQVCAYEPGTLQSFPRIRELHGTEFWYTEHIRAPGWSYRLIYISTKSWNTCHCLALVQQIGHLLTFQLNFCHLYRNLLKLFSRIEKGVDVMVGVIIGFLMIRSGFINCSCSLADQCVSLSVICLSLSVILCHCLSFVMLCGHIGGCVDYCWPMGM